jgi:hypothetical protein
MKRGLKLRQAQGVPLTEDVAQLPNGNANRRRLAGLADPPAAPGDFASHSGRLVMMQSGSARRAVFMPCAHDPGASGGIRKAGGDEQILRILRARSVAINKPDSRGRCKTQRFRDRAFITASAQSRKEQAAAVTMPSRTISPMAIFQASLLVDSRNRLCLDGDSDDGRVQPQSRWPARIGKLVGDAPSKMHADSRRQSRAGRRETGGR